MPKRTASSPSESPKKLRRSNSSSPAKAGLEESRDVLEAHNMDTSDRQPLPPLPVKKELFKCFDGCVPNDVTSLLDWFKAKKDDEDNEKRLLVDQYARDYLLNKILPTPEKWELFLETTIVIARKELSTPSLPIALIGDLVELSSMENCESLFEFVENRLEVWKEPFFMNTGKNAVLRFCNDLLKRLSRAQNTIFCGRILIFLANYFPFSERSGLNIMSEFNADNITSYKTGDGSDDPDDKMEASIKEVDYNLFEGMNMELPGLESIVTATKEEKKNRMKVDYSLYVKFWSLQDFYRSPQQCFNKLAWKTFTTYTQDVLGAFQCFKLDDTHVIRKNRTIIDNLNDSRGIPKMGDSDLYFAKYLTNRRLLELQMSDPSFRRYFLVQLLIILQYLTVPVKFKSESQVLNDEQNDYVKKMTTKIYELLAEIPPKGAHFAKAVSKILQREELWNKWKNDGCQPFKQPTASASISLLQSSDQIKEERNKDGDENKTGKSDDPLDIDDALRSEPVVAPRRHLGDIIEEANNTNKFDLGNSELTRLWNICTDNLEACRSKSRDFLPSMETFFAEAFKELDSEPLPLDPSKRVLKPKATLGNPNFGWRALRLLARRSPYFFQMFVGSPIHPMQNYLEYVLKRIAFDETPAAKEEQRAEQSNGKSNTDGDADNAIHGGDGLKSHEQHAGDDDQDEESVVEGEADEDDEMLGVDLNPEEVSEPTENRENQENLRNLTSEEMKALGKNLGEEWRTVASKLGFTPDEVEFFASSQGDNAGCYVLQLWTEQEGTEANVADLLYTLEGLKLKQKAENILF